MRASLALSKSDTSGCLPCELPTQPTVLRWLDGTVVGLEGVGKEAVQGGRRSCKD